MVILSMHAHDFASVRDMAAMFAILQLHVSCGYQCTVAVYSFLKLYTWLQFYAHKCMSARADRHDITNTLIIIVCTPTGVSLSCYLQGVEVRSRLPTGCFV